MNDRNGETPARPTGSSTRRASLRALLGAAFAGALATPVAASAKGGKSSGKRCQKQRDQCRAFVRESCQADMATATCEETFFPCCDDFARCDAKAGLECLFLRAA